MMPDDDTEPPSGGRPEGRDAGPGGIPARWVGSSVGSILAAAAEEAQRMRDAAEEEARLIRAGVGQPETEARRRSELAQLEAEIAAAHSELTELRRSIAAATMADLAASDAGPGRTDARAAPVAPSEVSAAVVELDDVIELDDVVELDRRVDDGPLRATAASTSA